MDEKRKTETNESLLKALVTESKNVGAIKVTTPQCFQQSFQFLMLQK